MICFDFDEKVQKILNNYYSDLDSTDWKSWLEISSKEEFKELCLKASGLSNTNEIFERITHEITDSRSFSLNLEDFLSQYDQSYIPIVCHTSGTTNSRLSALKWFFMSKTVVKRNWAPGMQAIFESSGLTNENSVVIFVPSRIKHDGLQTYSGQKYISFYSSEFSQRIMLSTIKPQSYLLYEYKKAKSLDVIAKMLQLKDIAVISAPALTILGWANQEKLKAGIGASLQNLPAEPDSILKKLITLIKAQGLDAATRIIQKKLSKKLSRATVIFSVSSLSEDNWNLIRNFMNWEKGKEKFTNLYVISEVGPFAASISKKNQISTHFDEMFVFPLSFAVLEVESKILPLYQVNIGYGKLYVSRRDNEDVLININLGDVISVLDTNNGLPRIKGKILRSSFKLQYPIKFSNLINIPHSYEIFAGDFFIFNEFEIIEPRKLLDFLKVNCNFNTDSMLFLSKDSKLKDSRLILPYNSSCQNGESIKHKITSNTDLIEFHPLFEGDNIEIELIDDQPVDFLETRKNKIRQVQTGEIPKGILKKWPLYVLKY